MQGELLFARFFDDKNIFVGPFHVIMFARVFLFRRFEIFGFLPGFFDFFFIERAIILKPILGPVQAVLCPKAVPIEKNQDKKEDNEREVVAILERLWKSRPNRLPRIGRKRHKCGDFERSKVVRFWGLLTLQCIIL